MSQIRLDMAVHARTPSLSRSFAQQLIRYGKVAVDGKVLTQVSRKIGLDAKIVVDYQQAAVPPINLPVVYEDGDCVVIDKPYGILSHSKGGFNPEPTVATWLESKTTGFDASTDRNGIVHRLDRATSGLMICAKTPAAHTWLQAQFSSRKVAKTYYALIQDQIEPNRAIIDMPIERNPKSPQRFRVNHTGKPAQTRYCVSRVFEYQGKQYSLLELSPKTGRTHQLRVHLRHLKKPIVGDTFYEGISADRLYLHAAKLEIILPNNQKKTFVSKLPSNFTKPKLS